MGQTLSVTGMVLSAMPVGEYDKRIVMLTKELGKITVFARGARRPGNLFMAAANPFCFGTFEIFEGRNSYSLAKTDIKNYFRELAEDLDCACYGFYFLEVAAYYSQENMGGTDVLNLLYVSLRALLKPALDKKLVRRIFELRFQVLSGEYPNVFSCMKCGTKDQLFYFSFSRHGILCPDCLKNERAIPLDASTLYALQFIETVPLEKLYTFQVTDAVFFKLDEIISRYIKENREHSFKSEEML